MRHLFSQSAPFPIPETVYDYYLDHEHNFSSWKDLVPSISLAQATTKVLIPTPITATYSYLLTLLNSVNQSAMLVGRSGIGKSAIVGMYIENLLKQHKDEVALVRASFSARTSSEKTQQFIESKLERSAAGVFSGTSHKKLVVFLDDVSMPAKETFGSQPPIELLRQLLDFHGFYDRKKGFFKKINNFNLICASGLAGTQQLSPRFLRHFHIFYISEPSNSTILGIFSQVLSAHLDKTYQDSVRKSIPTIISASIDLYEKIVQKLKPTPLKFHYQYNLRDIEKVIQGITLASPATVPTVDKLTKLWIHECCRVFYDRLTNAQDRAWFNTATTASAIKYFKSGFLNEEWLEEHPLLFTNIMTLDSLKPVYEEITDKRKLKKMLEGRLDDFNAKSKAKMNLELFDEALEHAIRIARSIYQPRGHLMAIGIGGSGKQSLSRLASFLLSYEIFQLELTKNYNIESFHNDLKKMMEITGLQKKTISFIFSDQEMINDSFLEDINSLINTGEISDLYTEEEQENILNSLRAEISEKQKSNTDDTKEALQGIFVGRVRDRLHILICTSPVGNSLRNRCKMFPALINCSTLDWFEAWPEQALISIANAKLGPLNLAAKQLIGLASSLHLLAQAMADNFREELRRVAYVTPKLFFDFLELFAAMLRKTSTKVVEKKKKLTNGLQKLHDTRKLIAELRIKLQEMIPDLEIQKKKAEAYYVEVQKETLAAVDLHSAVEKETEFIEIQAEECKFRALDAEKDLAEAMPILETAIKAVQALEKNKKDIIEFKKYLKPPEAVKTVMEAVCILLNERTDWSNAISVLGQMDFLQRLIAYNRESVTNSIFKKLRLIVTRPEFQPEIVAQSSEAARSLCIWCIAMYKFTEAYRIVKPKREKVAAMQTKLKSDMEKLEKKQGELRGVEEKVSLLKDECAATEAKVVSLEKNINVTGERVQRAELLLELLAEEGLKWSETLVQIDGSMKYIESESLLTAGSICYLGVYGDLHRSSLKSSWISALDSCSISADYSVVNSIGVPIDIRSWQIAGLPKDATSIENGVLVVNSLKWALMIDPQEQARRWIKNMEGGRGLDCVRPNRSSKDSTRDLLRILEAAITQGRPVLFEEVGEVMEASIPQVISRKMYKKEDGRLVIRLADHEIPYDEGFSLYLLCKLANPKFLPDVFGNLNVINFTVTTGGLEDQLLIEAVKLEDQRLERERDDIIVSLASDQKLLEEAQNSILDMIAESQGYILDNLALISALQRSKSASKDIIRRVAATAVVEERVNASRDTFRVIATRGTILYFVVADLPGINPMYQYSLRFFIKVYNNAIQNTEGKTDRVQRIIANITRSVFTVISRGLFEKDKQLLTFLFAAGISRNSGEVSAAAWNLFIRGGGLLAKKQLKKNPIPDRLNEVQWDFLCKLEENLSKPFEGLTQDITLFTEQWISYTSQNTQSQPAPNKFCLLDPFSKILLIKALRPEKLIYAISDYTKSALGDFFAEFPNNPGLESVFEESDKRTPIIFVLSEGTDPIENILKVGRDRGMSDKLQTISLGQGQGAKAQEAFERNKVQGGWILLQNCHLARSWLVSLESLIDNLQDDPQTHRDFRVILTSMPSDYFPVSILQNSLKITTEGPSGIKANLLGLYEEISQASENDSTRPEVWRKMVFAISFFHALVMERRKFGALGFNIRYEFNDSDFHTSIKLIKLLLEENEETPWEGIQYIVGNINYGGRVTDLNDRICLLAIFNKCFNPEMLEDQFFYTENETYRIPSESECLSYIRNLPLFDSPEIFGLNVNAQITLESHTSASLLQCLLQTQPQEVSTEASNSDKTVHDISKSLSITLSDPIDIKCAHADLLVLDSNGAMPSLSTFLFQELDKFNILLSVMRVSLKDLRNAIKGKSEMTEELSEMYASVLCSKVPACWQRVAYPSLKSLGSWVKDLATRVKFMFDWIKYGSQSCYWLAGFFFPQSFLTSVLQSHARRHVVPIDTLVFTFEVTPWTLQEFRKSEADGVFVYGMYLEGARWDKGEMVLVDAVEKEIYFCMPVIQFLPTRDYVVREGDYQCPVYKTTKRAGVLSSTGLSTNFIVYVDLPSDEAPDKWTLLGTAMVCQLNS